MDKDNNKTFIIDSNFHNTRLDKFLKKQFVHIPQSFIEKNIRKKNVLVNGKKSKSDYKLSEQDEVKIRFDFKQNTQTYKKTNILDKDVELLKKNIVFENQDYCILNKPSGIASQPGSKVKKNIIDILNFNSSKSNYYIVHRLDLETTGLMLIAKNREYAVKFSNAFQKKEITKTYIAIIKGKIKSNSGEVLTDEEIDGKKVTYKSYFEVILKNERYSYIKINLITGKKHQIRKQFSSLGHPVIGDDKYNLEKNKNDLMLHSSEIEFSYKDKNHKYKIDPPKYFEEFVKQNL